MKKFYLTLVIFLLFCNLSHSQVIDWSQRYNGTGNSDDQGSDIAIDASGNVYVTGQRTGLVATGLDITTIKYNSSGVQQWLSVYDGPSHSADYGQAIVVDLNGNVYVTGYGYGPGTGYDLETIKYNSTGVQQWVSRYNGTGSDADFAESIAVDALGNVYVTGSTRNIFNAPNSDDYVTIKYNSSGVQQWATKYNGLGNDEDQAICLAVDASGNTYVTGRSILSGTNYDIATVKYNSSGVQQWVTRYNGAANSTDEANKLVIDNSNNVYVCGKSVSTGTSNDYVTIKYNSSGVQQWATKYNGTANNSDEAYDLAVDATGNVYVTGYSRSGSTIESEEYATVKYNSGGVQQWVQRYTSPANNSSDAEAIALDAAGNCFVTGYSYGIGSGIDYVTVAYNSSGVQQWVARLNGTGNGDDEAASIAVDNNNRVYITGQSTGSGSGTDFLTVVYSHTIGIHQISSEVPKEFMLSQNYPNPFNPNSKIKFQIAKLSDAKLVVFDILGREVATLVNEELKPGTYEVEFDGTNLPSGVYYYTLKTDPETIPYQSTAQGSGFRETKKMVLIK